MLAKLKKSFCDVRETVPLQQGLKHWVSHICQDLSNVRMPIPLQQGLKQVAELPESKVSIGSNAYSATTRIETLWGRRFSLFHASFECLFRYNKD